jgi:O-antigen ligase
MSSLSSATRTGTDISRAAELAAAASTAMLVVVLPVAMVPANRSSPLVLAVAALLAAVSVSLDPGPRALAVRIGQVLRTPEAILVGALAVWGAASGAWSVAPRMAAQSLGEVLVPLVAAAVIVAALPDRLPRWTVGALAAGLALASVLVLVEMRMGFPLRKSFGGRAEAYVMNRPAVTILCMGWPLVAVLRSRAAWARLAPLILLGIAAIILSYSGSAKQGLAVGVVVFLATLLAPVAMRRLGDVLLLVVVAIQPVFGIIADRTIPEPVFDRLAAAHARERADIWLSFGEVARLRPWMGTGLGSSAVLDRDPVVHEVSPPLQHMLGVGHPHDAFLQVWVELGLVGAILVAGLIGLLARRLAAMPVSLLPERLAFLAGVGSIALVSHGAWQSWWYASVAAGVLLFRLLPADRDGSA